MSLSEKPSKRQRASRRVVLVGIMAATVECGKLALAFIPNVEVVTLFLALFSYVFGFAGIAAALVFVCIEPLIWGFGTWVVSYLIYWPTVSLVFFFLGRAKLKNRLAVTLIVAVLTFLFGVLSSLIDIGLLSGFFDKFFERFFVYYARGAVFYAVHVVSNIIIFFFLFNFLLVKLDKIKSVILN
ncbi:MAG: hypothetical protein IJW38_02895 [Clostridia bacterium]|nr:hypothetical protein [Clostridia bacterium]